MRKKHVFLSANILQGDIQIELVMVAEVTVLPAKSDSDVMFCLQSYQWLRIKRSLVY